MSIGAVNAANDSMMMVLQLIQSVQTAQTELAQDAISVNIQNAAGAEKMEIAGQIIDTYA